MTVIVEGHLRQRDIGWSSKYLNFVFLSIRSIEGRVAGEGGFSVRGQQEGHTELQKFLLLLSCSNQDDSWNSSKKKHFNFNTLRDD